MNALLIAGNSKRCLDAIQHLNDFLKSRLGFSDAVVVKTAYMASDDFDLDLKRFFSWCEDSTEPLLLAYSGHGKKDPDKKTWSICDDELYPYVRLVKFYIRNYQGPVMILNDCCYSGAIIPHLEAEKCCQCMGGVANIRARSESLSFLAAPK